MKRLFGAMVIALTWTTGTVFAQSNDVAWVQIEAKSNLSAAQTSVRSYAARLPDVSGFALSGGWYGIVLGPYSRRNADEVLRVYRAEGTIPRDSFIAFSSSFGQQFWPVGANVLSRGVVEPPANATAPDVTPTAQTPTEPAPQIAPADETKREAQRSERDLSADDRKALQVALKWAGFYNASIDGAFGRGTRASMAAWQDANNYDPTGVLTTLQRAALIGQYNAVLDGLDLKLVRDEAAGIEMQIPTGVVEFDRYEAPFAHYKPKGDLEAKVLLISQTGDQNTLFGLYDIMQTLEIVPLDGPRDRDRNSFRLVGENAQIVSHTEVRLENDQIKGFTLIWPAGDEERRTRLLAEMQKSFVRNEGVLLASLGDDQTQAIDLVAGLQVRKPRISRSGFYIDGSGAVLTTSEAVQSCTRITVDEDHDAELVVSDADLGVAVLRPTDPLAPLSVARLRQTQPRLQSEVAVAGYSFEGVLGAPTMTFGTLADLQGLRGEPELKRLALAPLPGDAGGPVFDTGGNVLGMLLPKPASGPQLPDEVSFAADAGAIRTLLDQAGVTPVADAESTEELAPRDLTDLGAGMTVLVSCWD